MFQSIWQDLQQAYRHGNMIIRLIFINVAVFLFFAILPIFIHIFDQVGGTLHDDIVHFFCISADWYYNLTHPWVIFTHMFMHAGFFHLGFNMLFLYWFGRITGDLLGDRHILPLYLLGGLFGAVIYFLSANFLPESYQIGDYALGASAAVMAIMAAAGVTAPEYRFNLFLLGPVALKFIVIFFILVDVVGIGSLSNTGGHLAHLGGVFLGYMYVSQMRSTGTDWSIPVNSTLDKITNFFTGIFSEKKPGPKVAYKNPKANKRTSTGQRARQQAPPPSASHQEQLDSILDKIKQNGYESLSAEEKEFLFNASKS